MSELNNQLKGYKGHLYYASVIVNLEDVKCPACGNPIEATEFSFNPPAEISWKDLLHDKRGKMNISSSKTTIKFRCSQCLTEVEMAFGSLKRG